jgi:hypothetical protein
MPTTNHGNTETNNFDIKTNPNNQKPDLRARRQDQAAPNIPPPPPKENPNLPLAVLVKIRERLEYLLEDINSLEWPKDSPQEYHHELAAIADLTTRISKGVKQ